MLLELLAFVPVLAFILLILAVWKEQTGARTAFIQAAILWGVLAFLITETLSVFHAVTRAGLSAAWLLVVLATALYVAQFRRSNVRLPARWAAGALSSIDDLDAAFLTAMAVIAGGVGLVAMAAPPNTLDALAYHMPRIVHWLQNQSVSFYPTSDLRQVVFPPWAQYAMLQLHGPSGADHFDNLVQWFSLLGSAICVSLVARALGAGLRGQMLAALICFTIPQGVLGASGSQDGYVTAFWIVVSVYIALTYSNNPTMGNAVALGAAVGLAVLTKSTVVILLPPLLLAVALARPTPALEKWIKCIGVSLLVVLALNGTQLVRTYKLYHLPSGPSVSAPPTDLGILMNQAYGVPQIASNVIRNLALHAGTPSSRTNALMERAVTRLLSAFGQTPSDPRTTFAGLQFHIARTALQEDIMGNPIHLFLIVLTCILLFWRWRTPAWRPASWLALGLVGSFLIFCIVLKWQPAHSRLHLPLFVVGSALVGVVLAQVLPKRLTAVVGMTIVLAAMPAVLENQTRRIFFHSVFTVPRGDQYFATLPELIEPYRDAVEFVKTQDCSTVGLDTAIEPYEYLLQTLLGNRNGHAPVKIVNVQNVSLRYDTGDEAVPCVICPGCVQEQNWASFLSKFSTRTSFGGVEVLTGRRLAGAPSLPVTSGLNDETARGTGRGGSEDLARSARRASAAVTSRQQVPGYWLTSYTDEARFRRPRVEMNTFLSSVMVDILNPVAAAAGLDESLQKARHHLAGQIEDGGLVRYHGRPDGPTIGTSLGCVITPDADDTSLVWRIAPGTHPELLPVALATLDRYRTPEGLYRTWLAPRDAYRCIDPGKDPNPADVAIQMHVFLLLAQANPPAAQALCRALGNAIADERIWVYYQTAPLIPILRQAALRSAGCSLPLPPYRLRPSAGQEDWVAASQLLQHWLGAGGPVPEPGEVLDLLRRLSQDDFASLRRSPPLLYHNDLSASVSRFYWSEEFGYALWLRLYFENLRHGSVRPVAKDDHARCCLR